MSLAFSARVRPSPDVLISQIQGESVLLDVRSEKYFGLDDVGTRMWELLTAGGTVRQAYEALLAEYAVQPDQLQNDLEQLIEKLRSVGLIQVSDA
jgi:hypothetical protein